MRVFPFDKGRHVASRVSKRGGLFVARNGTRVTGRSVEKARQEPKKGQWHGQCGIAGMNSNNLAWVAGMLDCIKPGSWQWVFAASMPDDALAPDPDGSETEIEIEQVWTMADL
jgi:hypothetical protein